VSKPTTAVNQFWQTAFMYLQVVGNTVWWSGVDSNCRSRWLLIDIGALCQFRFLRRR
jgi:hypothetical protein